MPAGTMGRGYRDAKATPPHNGKIGLETPIPDEKRNKVPDIGAEGVRWYVCTTAPQQELRAAESVRRISAAGVPPMLAYVPCEFFWRRPQRSNLRMPRREFQLPRMRHYLFVGIAGGMGERDLAALRERDPDGRNVHGLVGILGAGSGKPLYLSDEGKRWISGFAEEERAGTADVTGAGLRPDDSVRITSGPFAMFTGRLVAVDTDRGETIVELSLMGHKTDIRLSLEDVEKAA